MNNIEKLFFFDKQYNTKYVLGVDEAGRGPGAGDVFAACVCFDLENVELAQYLKKLNDSKKLSSNIREDLYKIIVSNFKEVHVYLTMQRWRDYFPEEWLEE